MLSFLSLQIFKLLFFEKKSLVGKKQVKNLIFNWINPNAKMSVQIVRQTCYPKSITACLKRLPLSS